MSWFSGSDSVLFDEGDGDTVSLASLCPSGEKVPFRCESILTIVQIILAELFVNLGVLAHIAVPRDSRQIGIRENEVIKN